MVGCGGPNFVEIGEVTHHAIDDGVWGDDALGRKLLHVLIDVRGQLAKFIDVHAFGCLKSAATLAGTSSMMVCSSNPANFTFSRRWAKIANAKFDVRSNECVSFATV